jgi:lipid II:glycine glycyltransferase (peptidoglycan interpeptide bridge formation enzyme)
MQLIEVTDQAQWDQFVSQHPQGHPLQLWGWGESKRNNTWTPHRLVLQVGEEWTAGVQVLLWPIPRTGRFIAYVPRGPVVDPSNPAMARLMVELVAWAKRHKALYVRVEPAWTKAKLPHGWKRALHTLQMSKTYTIDLHQDEAALLEPMARKHRQYIRKAERDGVTVERLTSANLHAMYDIYSSTAQRAGFGIHAAEYYEQLFEQLGDHNYVYYAHYEGQPVAFLWLAAAGETAYELYGGVTEVGQDMKANYYLKWRAVMDLKAAGYRIYDFNGRLNEGVSRFKEGFGPAETDYIGTWDYPLNVLGYQLWERLWPIAKPIGRRLARARGRHSG